MTKQEFQTKKQKGELNYHHTSIARGYVAVDSTWYEEYDGRFGKGVIEHEETLHSRMRSNSHHFVHYYIYK